MNYLSTLVLLQLVSGSFTLFIFQNKDISAKKPILSILSGSESKVRRGRITNGYIADKGSQFLPYYTLIYVRRNNFYSMCAGSIISENFILSAGEKINNL